MKTSTVAKVPTEAQEQHLLFVWAEENGLDLLYHIPNEGLRNPKTGYILKLTGMKKGVPDVFLPIASDGYHGLYIEMKRVKGSKVSPEQLDWISKLSEQGYKCVIAHGHLEAEKAIREYLKWEGVFFEGQLDLRAAGKRKNAVQTVCQGHDGKSEGAERASVLQLDLQVS